MRALRVGAPHTVDPPPTRLAPLHPAPTLVQLARHLPRRVLSRLRLANRVLPGQAGSGRREPFSRAAVQRKAISPTAIVELRIAQLNTHKHEHLLPHTPAPLPLLSPACHSRRPQTPRASTRRRRGGRCGCPRPRAPTQSQTPAAPCWPGCTPARRGGWRRAGSK